MNAEKIILTKAYIELTSQELDCITSLVSSEDEFNKMKEFFIQSNKFFSNKKIKSPNELDRDILSYLHQSPSQKAMPWYNTVLLFLFPRDKNIFYYPAFQLAMTTILIFGAFNLFNNSFDSKTNSIAKIENVNPNQFDNFNNKGEVITIPNVGTMDNSNSNYEMEETKSDNNQIIEIEEEFFLIEELMDEDVTDVTFGANEDLDEEHSQQTPVMLVERYDVSLSIKDKSALIDNKLEKEKGNLNTNQSSTIALNKKKVRSKDDFSFELGSQKESKSSEVKIKPIVISEMSELIVLFYSVK